MGRLDTIVVGVDGSTASLRALAWATSRGSADGELHVVHAFSSLRLLGLGALQQDGERALAAARDRLDGQWTEPVRQAGRRLRTHLVDDDPADALLAVAAASGADLVVVGRHGADGGRLLLGSVTSKLLHRAELPVVVVDAEQPPLRSSEAGPVVACVGYGDASDNAVEWAAEYAAESALSLRLFHVVGFRPMFPADSPADTLASYLGPEVALEWAQDELDELAARLSAGRPALDVSTKLDRGWAIPAMQRASEGAELVVVGRRHLGPRGLGIISPRIQRLVARSDAPTAVVPACPDAP